MLTKLSPQTVLRNRHYHTLYNFAQVKPGRYKFFQFGANNREMNVPVDVSNEYPLMLDIEPLIDEYARCGKAFWEIFEVADFTLPQLILALISAMRNTKYEFEEKDY